MSSCFWSKRTFAPQNVMSALPPKADSRCVLSDIATSRRRQRGKTLSTVTFLSLTRRAKALPFPFGQRSIA
jgi:hypothetical protein